MWAKPLVLCLLALSPNVDAGIPSRRSSNSDSFSLYAYGNSIRGLPLYYADGKAVLAHHAPDDATDAGQVSFPSGSSGPLVGNPASETDSSGKRSSSGSFSNQQLFLPSANSTDPQVGFTSDPSSDQITTKFIWYGHFLLVETEDGEYTSLFYAKKHKTQEGVYSLQWNITDDDDDEDTEYHSISMRSIPPSNV